MRPKLSRATKNIRGTKMLGLSAAAALLGMTAAAQASILTIGTWASAPANDSGAPSGTSGSGSTGSITLAGTGGESSDVPFTSQSLNVGDTLTLTGNVAWITAGIGNQQFRFGIFNTNSHTSTDVGFDGYIAEVPNTSVNNGIITGMNPSSSSAWQGSASHYGTTTVAGTGTTTNGGAGTGNPPSPTYNFTMSLTYVGTNDYSVLASLVASDYNSVSNPDFSWTANYTDTTSGSASSSGNTIFNDFGFFFGSGAGLSASSPNNVINFSNVQVAYTPVPEPASLGLLGASSVALFARARRRRAIKA